MALINLVVNAIHAMEGGRHPDRRHLRARRARSRSRWRTRGPGIPASIQPTIFEPFFTTKPEGKGTGLGLSTVLMVVERHKGRIDFTSSRESGTTFRIHLPIAGSTAAPPSVSPRRAERGSTATVAAARAHAPPGFRALRRWHGACLGWRREIT